MLTRLFRLLAVLTLFTPALSLAETVPLIGHCNVAMAVMLHPLMAHLDTSTGRFHGAALPNGSGLANQASAEIESQRKQLSQEVDQIKKEIAEANQQFIGSLHALNRERDSREKAQDQSSPGTQTEEYSNKRRELEQAHRQNILSIRSKLSFKESELEKLNSEAKHTDQLPVRETERVFKLILDDVQAAVAAVTKREKLSFVFNSATAFRFQHPSQAFIEGNPLSELLDPAKPPKPATGSDIEYSLLSRLYQWTTSEMSQLYHCNDGRLTRFVLEGGLDITPAVVGEVYKKHNVGQAAADLVQKLFRSDLMK